jgi:subtilisin family serine protease
MAKKTSSSRRKTAKTVVRKRRTASAQQSPRASRSTRRTRAAAAAFLGRYVVLKKSTATAGDPFGGRALSPLALHSAMDDMRPMEIDVAELTGSEVADARRDPGVLSITPSMPIRLVKPVSVRGATVPAGGGVAWGVEAVHAGRSTLSGSGINVAVLDTGIDASHPAFAGMNLVQRDFTGEGIADAHGHGTHCAGTIFGRDVDGFRIGVARGVQRGIIGKVLGSEGGSTESIAQAINWAVDEGAHVISMSLGVDFPGFVELLIGHGFPPELATSRALEAYRANVRLYDTLAAQVRAQGMLMGRGAVLVAAAGNESRRELHPDFEITVAPPATADGIVSVAAVGRAPGDTDSLVIADFSNTGANVAAPGVAVISARRGGGVVSMNGTSMATPYVAGVTALWAERLMATSGGMLVGDQLVARVLGTARVLPGIDPMAVGAGIVTAP